jgi:hypothetical protein
MSALGRTALRLAGIAALNADPVITALCPPSRVFDSRIAVFNETEPVPVIVVLTEEMEGDAYDDAGGGPPFDDKVDLVVEIAIRAIVATDGQDDATPVIGVPETDAEMEATLDMIEHRALEALTVADTAQSLLVRQAVLRRAEKQKSQRFVDDATGAKLAIRQLMLTASLKGEDQQNAVELIDPTVAAAAHGGNTGNGTLTLASPAYDDTVLKGAYTVTFTAATAFIVTDPAGTEFNSGVLDAAFADQVRFGIAPGTAAFVAGDSFTLTVGQGPYAMLPGALRQVCNAMADGSSGKATCDLIAGAYGAPAAIALFTGANLTVAPQQTLNPTQAPIAPGDPGANPAFGYDNQIPSSDG